MSSATPDNPATSYFTGLAKVYAECRPTYPHEAIEAAFGGLTRPLTVADVGCGTGISTRLLASRGAGARVIGIDPNGDMLAQAQQEHRIGAPGSPIEYRQGTGERTGLPEHSVDVVVCAQSFHWFDAAAALREFHRILRPVPGRLALIWNVRDDGDSFSAGYGEIVHRAQADAEKCGRKVGREHHSDPTIGGFFKRARTLVFANEQRLDVNGLLGRIRSASYFPRPDNPLRSTLESDLARLFHQHQRDGFVSLTYRTEVTLADRVHDSADESRGCSLDR